MKFELQTSNPVWRTRGKRSEKLPRKFGPHEFLHKGKHGKKATKKKEGTAIELQSEHGGFVEFETPKWFSSWCALKQRIEEAVDMVEEIKKAKKVGTSTDGHDLVEFPFGVGGLRRTKSFPQGLRAGETLQVEIADPDWNAAIQSSESFELSQYESFLTEHEHPPWAAEAISKAKEIVKDANTKKIPDADVSNLRNFLEMILDYILNAQNDWKFTEKHAAKEYLRLMARTSFSAMYRELLSKEEQDLFDAIVKSEAILTKMGLTKKSLFYAHGVRGPLASLTVSAWLGSIAQKGHKKKAGKVESRKEKDRLSRPAGGSAAMGRFDVETEPGEHDSLLVKFETRSTTHGRIRPVWQWVSYAEELFKQAAASRGRSGTSTELKYEPKDCP